MRRKQMIIKRATTPLLLILTLTMTACEHEQQALRALTREGIRQQQQQNQHTTLATRTMIEADAVARRELVELQQDLQSERLEVGRQRDALEGERKAWALKRHRDPILANTIQAVAMLLICAMPLVLCWRLLIGLTKEPDKEHGLGELLVHELVSDRPTLIPSSQTGVPAICHVQQDDQAADATTLA